MSSRSFPSASRVLPVCQTASRGPIVVDESGKERVPPTKQRLAQAAAAGADAVVEIVTEVDDEQRDIRRRATTVRLIDRDPLELLHKRKIITRDQYACGLEYHRHYMASGLAGRVPDWERVRVDGGQHKPESEQLAWHLGVFLKMEKELGSIHARVLHDCIISQISLLDYGLRHSGFRNEKQAQGWGQASFVNALRQLEINLLHPEGNNGGIYAATGRAPARKSMDRAALLAQIEKAVSGRK